jgi:hypothetical protein
MTYWNKRMFARSWPTIRCCINLKLNNVNKILTQKTSVFVCVLPWLRYLVLRKTVTKYFNIREYLRTELRLQRRSEFPYLKIYRTGKEIWWHWQAKIKMTIVDTKWQIKPGNTNYFNTSRLLLFCIALTTVYRVGGFSPRSVFRLVSGRGNIVWVPVYP